MVSTTHHAPRILTVVPPPLPRLPSNNLQAVHRGQPSLRDRQEHLIREPASFLFSLYRIDTEEHIDPTTTSTKVMPWHSPCRSAPLARACLRNFVSSYFPLGLDTIFKCGQVRGKLRGKREKGARAFHALASFVTSSCSLAPRAAIAANDTRIAIRLVAFFGSPGREISRLWRVEPRRGFVGTIL